MTVWDGTQTVFLYCFERLSTILEKLVRLNAGLFKVRWNREIRLGFKWAGYFASWFDVAYDNQKIIFIMFLHRIIQNLHKIKNKIM